MTPRPRPTSAARRTTSEHVFETLRQRILAHGLAAGVHLVEADLAREFGVSTTPIREALQRLVQIGLADRQAARGVTVHRMTMVEVGDLFEMRMLLEPAGLRGAARFMDAAAWADLEAALRTARQALDRGRIGELVAANARFHLGLIERCRNRLLLETLASLADRRRLLSVHGWAVANRSHEEWDEHWAILEAARSGRVDRAAELLREHIQRFMVSTLAALEALEGTRRGAVSGRAAEGGPEIDNQEMRHG